MTRSHVIGRPKTAHCPMQGCESLFITIKKACLRQDNAYDVIVRPDVLKHFLVTEALSK
jgi:hypothetical protein